MTPAESLYRALLRLYPPEFRQAYGKLMQQHARDLELAARKRGRPYVAALYLRLISDGLLNAGKEHWAALRTAGGSIKPAPWTAVLLAAIPGLLLALGRRHADILGLPLSVLGIAYLVLLVAALPIAWRRVRHVPVWTLLPLGMLVSLLILRYGTAVAPQTGPMDMLLPLGVITLLLAIGASAARQHNVLALLVLIGGYVYLFADNDTLWGSPYRDWPFLPLYFPAMISFFFILAPTGLLRAKTHLGRALALFIPATIFLAARLAIPALVLGQAYTIRPGDALISATVLLSLIIGWIFYGRLGSSPRDNQPAPSFYPFR